MYDRMNEEVAWQRLQDLQREVENSRMLAGYGTTQLTRFAERLGDAAWALVRGVRPRWWTEQGEAREVA